MEIGVDSFGAVISDPGTGITVSPVQRMENLLGEIVLADQVGLDVFGIANTTVASSLILRQSSFSVRLRRAQKTFDLQAPSPFLAPLTRSAYSKNLPPST